MQQSVGEIIVLLDKAESETDHEQYVFFLMYAAWHCRTGILEPCINKRWPPTFIMFAQINGKSVKMTLAQATALTVGRLMNKAGELEEEDAEKIGDILDRGPWFDTIQHVIDKFT